MQYLPNSLQAECRLARWGEDLCVFFSGLPIFGTYTVYVQKLVTKYYQLCGLIPPRKTPPGGNMTILGFQLDKTKLPEAKS